MTCIKCQHGQTKRFGYVGKQRVQRYRCTFCKTTFVEPRVKPLDRHYTPLDKATQALAMMLEGCSVRAIERLTGVHRDTILALMNTAGEKAATAFDALVRNVPARRVQADEVWCFVHTKEGHLDNDDPAEWGHTYTWIALDADSKLVLSYHVGKRSAVDAFQLRRPAAALPDLRSGRQVQCRCGLDREGDGQPTDSHRIPQSLAERHCRALGWQCAARLTRSCDRAESETSATVAE